MKCGAVAQLGERDNRTVEVRGSSPLSSTCNCGAVAQLGEHLNGIQEVRGSSPLGSTKKRRRFSSAPFLYVIDDPTAPVCRLSGKPYTYQKVI